MKNIYVIEHIEKVDEYRELVKTLGIFDCEEKAKNAIDQLKKTPEFLGKEDGFSIDLQTLNSACFLEGYGEG
ncbi:hypothetical protein O4H49_05340 [Kiloniella laminariae]|uniref:Uncharacterized protein n=1 Tax=Kiloniella laminariae TaxID=454162 RepID=A0ABT4LGG0_9PROT|nr:hypothetical protein [Kiloniella laminariae]MCZ4280188.1 hypothetical protein [Kiloniella laminariae]